LSTSNIWKCQAFYIGYGRFLTGVGRFRVERFRVERFRVQRFRVQRFRVQGFWVEGFRGSRVQRLPPLHEASAFA